MNRVPITIWTDGSCTTKDDRKGGMGVYLLADGCEVALRRGYWNTTTPRMEQRALIAAVQMINVDIPTDVLIWCDSKFIVEAIMNGGVRQWRADGWKGVANVELWKEFVTEVEKRRKMRLCVRHINGHQKDLLNPVIYGNNVADALADYHTQDSYVQDRPLEGFSWYVHDPSSLIFIAKNEEHEYLVTHDDIIAMVDANLQRENILPSERAFAYKMKLEAIKRQGARTDLTSMQVAQKLSVEMVGDAAGISKDQVRRYIRLTELIPPILDMVDGVAERKISFNPAVELSYLTLSEQTMLLDAMEAQEATPSLSQAQRLKKFSQQGKLSEDVMTAILSEEKKEVDRITLTTTTLSKYFPKSYTPKKMEETIIKLLEQWQRKRQHEQER